MPASFTKPEGLIGRFAVVKPWPDVQAAEDENIARLQITARSMGLECIVVDPEGVCLDEPERRVTGRDVDFVINLHFETPKAYDAFSFVALWNPLRFFKDWGYRRYSKNLLTHDDFLSCSSTWADHHVGRMIADQPGRLPPAFNLYHSLSEPILEPALGHGKVFYAGINWDKLGKKKGRHQDLLLLLDKAGILRIHGPRIFNNVNVWEGYNCYVGPIPFDGVSMIQAISEAGIALVFSSDAHKESELMSNRLFESLAAGAIIICDDNPFARRYLGDTLLYVDTTESLENVAKQIITHHTWIQAHPKEALQMARAAQAIFKERFTLDRSLSILYSQLEERKRQLEASFLPDHPEQPVEALLLLPEYSAEGLDHLLESLETQNYSRLRGQLVLDGFDAVRYEESIRTRLARCPRPVEIKTVSYYDRRADGSLRRRLPLGRVLRPVLESLAPETWFIATTPNERWFTHHISSLVRALQAEPELDFSFTPWILRYLYKGRLAYEILEDLNLSRNNHIPPGFGRFLFRRSALQDAQWEMMDFLDMRALAPLLVRTRGAAANRTTALVRLHEPFVTGELLEDALEQQIVEDRYAEVRTDPELRHVQAASTHPGLVTSLQTAQQMTFQSHLLHLQTRDGAEGPGPRTLRRLRQLLLFELFHHEASLKASEAAAARLPKSVIAEANAEVMNSEKCDTLLAYWIGLHHEAAQRWPEAFRAFNRALQNAADTLPTHYIARAALKLAGLAIRLNQVPLAEKALTGVVLQLQPSNSQARAMLAKLTGKAAPQAQSPAAQQPTAPAEAKSANPPPPKPRAVTAEPVSATPFQPRVSAIVSTYKSERFLRGCLEDLEAQSIADELEIIVVDSNSPQNERAIVEEFQSRFANIVYIRSEQRETVYGAWNRGIKAARGKYVTNANTDDRHRPDALEILARTLDEKPEVSLVYADCLITPIENETFATTKATRRFQWLDFSPSDLLHKGCYVGPQPMWRRELHQQHGYFDAEMVSAGDYEFWLRLATSRKFLHVKETLGLYLESPSSVEHANQERGAKEVAIARQRYAPTLAGSTPSSGSRPAVKNEPTAPKTPPRKSTPLVLPPAALVGHLGPAKDFLRQRKTPAAWQATIAALGKRPFHPEAYLFLAEIAEASGDGQSARLCAEEARRLAPGWKPVRQFLNRRLKGSAHPQWLTLPSSLRSKPTDQGPKLSVLLITKNEEKFIGQCLSSVKDLADQIVVVDTGSTDRTVEIAKEHGAEVHSFTWCDDFSAARNAALEHVTGDWVLMLDADEELSPESRAVLQAHQADAGVIAWRLPIVDIGREDEGHSFVPRLFRNAPALFFVGRVHEQVFSSIEVRRQEWGLDNRLGEATLIHHGYTKEMMRDRNKIERNLHLLERAVEELPGEPNLLMSLGQELSRSGREAEALDRYWEAFRSMAAKPAAEITPELRETLLSQFATRLTAAKRFADVVQVLTAPEAQPLEAASLHFALGLAYLELGQFQEAAEQMRACLAKRDRPSLCLIHKDIRSAAPHHCLALCEIALGNSPAAEEAFQAALQQTGHVERVRLEYARFLFEQNRPLDALARLNEGVAANPQDTTAWQFGGRIALSKPEFLEFACDWTGEALRHLPRDNALLAQRAEALLLHQEINEAQPLWQQLVLQDPQPWTVAGLTFCQLASGSPVTAPEGHDPSALTRALLDWYRKAVNAGAQDTIRRLNARLDDLSPLLPDAAQFLKAVLADAGLAETSTN